MPKQAGRLPSGWPNPVAQWTRPDWAPDLDGLKHLQRELTPADVAQVEGFLPLYSAEVGFCGNVPLTSAQQNQYWFPSQAARIAYFKAKMRVKGGAPDLTDYDNNDNYFIYNNTSQIRNKGVILISTASRNLDNCNYLFYHDPYFDNPDVERQRWIYAFIDHVEYIAPSSCAVYYSVDPFQTYFMDMGIKPSYIERMTPDVDTMFGNTQPEGIDFGAVKTADSKFLNTLTMSGDGMTMLPQLQATGAWTHTFFYTTPESDGESVNQIMWIPLAVQRFSNGSSGTPPLTELRAFFQNTGHQIVAGYLLPNWLSWMHETIYEGTLTVPYSFAAGGNAASLDGYVPKNKKLYTYPYTFLEVTNNLGATLELRWEHWDTAPGSSTISAVFKGVGSLGLLPEVDIMPSGYMGQTNYHNTDLQLSFAEFPQVPWTSDAYNIWLQQNISRFNLANSTKQKSLMYSEVTHGVNGIVDSITGLGSGLISGLTGNFQGAGNGLSEAATGAFNGYADYLQAENQLNSAKQEFNAIKEDLTRTSDTVGGFSPGSMFNLITNRCGFTFNRKTIRKEYAWRIDSFFTKRGYKVGAVQTVDVTTMPRGYKYVEAPNIQLVVKNDSYERGVPNPAIVQMINAFAKGMTWWVPPPVVPGEEPNDTVGNYGQWLPPPIA